MKNVPLFDAPAAPSLVLSRTLAKFKAWRGTYATYRPVKRVHCDECVNVLHEAGGVGGPPNGAVMTRKAGSTTLRLCRGHGELWRAIDGVGEQKGKSSAGRRR